jgi:signal transduction histidine kinase
MPDEQMVRLTVEDAGPGVPSSALPRLFDKFYRVPGSAGGSRSGTGVGLAVVKGLVEATGGRVAVRRSELGGLALDMDLPRAAEAAGAADAAEAGATSGAGAAAGTAAEAGATSVTPTTATTPG